MADLQRLAIQPPNQRTFYDNKPTLLVSWWCTCYAIAVILFRFGGRYVRTEKLFREDVIMLLAMIPLLMRMAFVHMVLLYGTNNTITTGLTDDGIRQREIGSRYVLAARIMYPAFLWTIKYSHSIFLCNLTEQVWRTSYQRLGKYLHVLIAITFLATVISDLAGCQPFSRSWQVVPDPGPQCRLGYAHFLTMTTLNIITNLALVVFPIPVVMKSRIPNRRKVGICLRMALPLIGVAITLYQIRSVLARHGQQQFRSLVASIDILITTFTANAVVLISLLQDRGYKKTKYKYGATKDRVHISRDSRIVVGHWGSDENLVGSSDDDGNSKVIGMQVLKAEQKPPVPPKAKLQGIRIDQTWEIDATDRSPEAGSSKSSARW